MRTGRRSKPFSRGVSFGSLPQRLHPERQHAVGLHHGPHDALGEPNLPRGAAALPHLVTLKLRCGFLNPPKIKRLGICQT